MNKSEAQQIYSLTKSVKDLFRNGNAIKQMNQFVKDKQIGVDSRLLNFMRIGAKCAFLLQEKERFLTNGEVFELAALGIPAMEKKDLIASVGGSRARSNAIIEQIYENCANQVALSAEYKHFAEYILPKTQ